MRVMVIVKTTKNSEVGVMPSEQLLAAMGKYNEELVSTGILQSGEGLQPNSHGRHIAITSKGRTVINGPFQATSEFAASSWLWKVSAMKEAVDWAKRCPEPTPGEETTLDLRPLFEMEDFGDEMTPKLREKREGLRAELEGKEAQSR